MKARDAAQPQEKAEHRTQEKCRGILERRSFRPLGPYARGFAVQPELYSVPVHNMEIRAIRNFPNAQRRLAGLIPLRAHKHKHPSLRGNFSIPERRTIQMDFDQRCFARRAGRVQPGYGQVRMKGKTEDRVIEIQNCSVSTGANARKPSIVFLAHQSNLLRKLSNGSINSKLGRRIRFFCAPIDSLTHYWPPHASYTGLCEPTATKS